MVEYLENFGISKYAKNAIIAEKGVFQKIYCPRILFTKMFITPKFLTSKGFMMAHFEAKKL